MKSPYNQLQHTHFQHTFLALFLSLLLLLPTAALAQFTSAPAFPGAEGYGRYTTGGRGGTVYHVTTLEDYCDNKDYTVGGTDADKDKEIVGSLRYAIKKSGARIIVFDVAGTIELKAPLKIQNDNITILGQTAPGDGICLKNYTLGIFANNVIIRYIRCRMGNEGRRYWNNGTALTGKNQVFEDDAMNGYQKDGSEKTNVIIDHCSISWSVDECASFYGNKEFSLQWCIISESLRDAGHAKGAHGYGGIWGGEKASFHHNLVADHDSRNPRFDHGYVSTLAGPVDYTNNVLYNWGGNSAYGGENKPGYEAKKFNMINNYYRYGGATSDKDRLLNPTTYCTNCNSSDGKDIVPGKFYISGNYMYGSSTVTNDNTCSSAIVMDSKGISYTDWKNGGNISTIKFKASDAKFNYNTISLHTAEVTYDKVAQYAGASLSRDEIDIRLGNEAKSGNSQYYGSITSAQGLIDKPSDVGGYPTLTGTKATDTDGDGIPDEWEDAHGLNKNSAADALTQTLDSRGYYTNLEVYANYLVQHITKAERAGATETFTEYYPLDSDDPAPTQTVITASSENVNITGTVNTTVTLSSNNPSGAYSITTQPNASVATASISGSTITITGVAAGSTSLTVTQAATTGYTSATKTINITVTAAQGGGTEEFHAITSAEETILLTKANIDDKNYLSASTNNWNTGKTYGGVSGDFYNMSSSDRTLTIKLANCSKIKFTVNNSTNGRTYSYSINGGEYKTITHGGNGAETTSEITVPSGNVTIVLKGGGSSVYPISITAYKGTTPTTYTVSASATNGSVVIKNGSTTVASGTAVEDGTSLTFTATPADGYKFTQWNDGNTDNPRTVVVNGANVSLTAEFEEEDVETTLFSMTSTATGNVIVNFGQNQDLSGYATITGGSALIHNGHASSNATMISASGFSCLNSGGSYIKITLTTSLKEGDVLTTTGGDGGLVSLSASNADSDNISGNKFTFTSDYNGNNVIYVNRGHSKPTISSITITRGSNSGDTPDDGDDDNDVIEDPDPEPVAVKPAAKKGFNFVVGRDGDINAAIAAANVWTGSGRYLIFVPDGRHKMTGNATVKTKDSYSKDSEHTYYKWDESTGSITSGLWNTSTDYTDNAMTWLNKSNVSIIGQSKDGTEIYNIPYIWGISYTSTLEIRSGSSNTYLQDFTLKNLYAGGANDKGVAVAFYDRGTNTIAKNLNAWSNQDTYTSAATCCYYETSTFAGTVDFICGSGDVWFEQCDLVINNRSGNVITAPSTKSAEDWGYVFNHCTISKAADATLVTDKNWNLGRPWKEAPASTFLYTKMNVLPKDAAWTNMSDNLTIRFHEYGSTNSSGTLLDLSQRSVSACKGAKADKPVLTEAQASKYKVSNVLAGDDNWDPRALTLQVGVNNVQLDGNTLSWEDNDYALCWVVFKDGAYYANPITNSVTLTESGTYTVRAANSMGGLGEESEGKQYVDDRNGTIDADVKMTYVDYNNPTTSYGEVAEAYSGYNNINNNIVGLANTGWGKNWITYIQVDASNIPAGRYIKKATLSAKVSGSNDSKRQTSWGVGYNTSTWSSDMTYNTVDSYITTCGTNYTTTTKSASTFESVEFDITAALKYDEDNIATIIVYETAADGGKIKDVSALIEYTDEPPYELLSEDNNYTSFTEGTYNVKLKKTFPKDNKWTSLVLPFSATTEQLKAAFPNEAANTEIAVVKEMKNNIVYFTTQAHIDANVPVLIKVGDLSADNTYTFTGVTVKNSSAPNSEMKDGIMMKGLYKKTGYDEDPLQSERHHVYFVAQSKFYDWSYLSYMPPFSAYIYTGAANNVTNAKAITFMLGDDDTTGVYTVNGYTTVEDDAAEYNAVGQRIGRTTKGLHISKGKKYFVK